MSDTAEEEVYSTIFNALRHGVRRRILRMLSERQMTFTAINENLSISSSHLTYHLDSLGELVSKNDSDYRLSVFGRAAVDMMNNIEEPPNLEGGLLNQRTFIGITAILVIGLIIMSGTHINLYNNYREVSFKYEFLSNELEAITSEYDLFKELEELVIQNPYTRFSHGFDIVSGYSLEYEEIRIDSHLEHSVSGFYAMIYAPIDNLTLRMYPFVSFPIDGFELPLTLQRGNAFRNESGVPVEEGPLVTHWQSPIIWSVNATDKEVYDARLTSRGWYTLSMTGPIRIGRGGGLVGKLIGVRLINGTWVREDRVKAWVDFKLMKGEETVLFAISRRR